MQGMEPRCVVDVDQMVVADGNIVTGGAAFAHVDLVLHLLRAHFNPLLADAVSRTMVIDGRQSQAQYIVPARLANGNELASKVMACICAAVYSRPRKKISRANFCPTCLARYADP